MSGAGRAPKRRVGVLISGRGSNMVALAQACRRPEHPAEIALVLSDDRAAPGLDRAAELGVPTQAVHRRDYATKPSFETALNAALAEAEIEVVCLAGFMRVLSAEFVARWPGRILNIHPSLLPSFPGLDAAAQALSAGVKIHGATVHVVTAELDAGPIVAQAAIPVEDDDDAERLSARLLPIEHALYAEALAAFLAPDASPTSIEPSQQPSQKPSQGVFLRSIGRSGRFRA